MCFEHKLVCIDSLRAIRHEKELCLILTCQVTGAFCACDSDVCIQKTVYQKFKLIWFKMHDFSAIYDNENQTDVF